MENCKTGYMYKEEFIMKYVLVCSTCTLKNYEDQWSFVDSEKSSKEIIDIFDDLNDALSELKDDEHLSSVNPVRLCTGIEYEGCIYFVANYEYDDFAEKFFVADGHEVSEWRRRKLDIKEIESILSEETFSVYCDTDPIDIYEDKGGYRVEGCIEFTVKNAEELDEALCNVFKSE